MGKKYQNEALMVSHQSAEALFHLGVISDTEMRKIEKDCLVQETKIDQVTEIIPETEYIAV